MKVESLNVWLIKFYFRGEFRVEKRLRVTFGDGDSKNQPNHVLLVHDYFVKLFIIITSSSRTYGLVNKLAEFLITTDSDQAALVSITSSYNRQLLQWCHLTTTNKGGGGV